MRKSRFREEQLTMALRHAEPGTSVEEICRQLGVSRVERRCSSPLEPPLSAAEKTDA